jgi:peptide/nickel transport system permease protein
MRITDVTFGFPDLLLVVFLSVALRQPVVEFVGQLYQKTQWGILKETIFLDYLMVFGALAMVNWAGTARLIRGQILSLREQDFIRAVYALGVPGRQIITRHLVPNAMAPIMVGLSIGVGGAMIAESSLSFLGLGIQPPGASWGNMISENLLRWRQYPHLVAMPGITLAVAVFGFNFLGDGINDAMNPKQIRR